MFTLVFALHAVASAGDLSALDAMSGYGGLAWGSAPSAHMLTLDSRPTLDGIKSYVRPEEPNLAGGIEIERRWYDYCFDRLCGIRLIGPTPLSAITAALQDKYGPPTSRNSSGTILHWAGSKVDLVCDFSAVTSANHIELIAQLRAAGLNSEADELEDDIRDLQDYVRCEYWYLPIAGPQLPDPGL